ncbi:MAG: biotin/lipoyl-containing protein [Clostridiales bacterium]|nr:biotin/lipoyl-containing protein [Clostridiales bacterium]
MAVDILLPKLGVTMTEGKILRWLKNEGDFVKNGEALFEIETDKTIMEVESTEEGILKIILVQEGETVPVTSIIGVMGGQDEEIYIY